GVVRPNSSLLTVQHSGIDQNLQMMRDRGLTQPHRINEITHAGLVALVSRDERNQPQPGRIGNRLEDSSKLLRALNAERLARQRRAAGGWGWQCLFSHPSPIMPTYWHLSIRRGWIHRETRRCVKFANFWHRDIGRGVR